MEYFAFQTYRNNMYTEQCTCLPAIQDQHFTHAAAVRTTTIYYNNNIYIYAAVVVAFVCEKTIHLWMVSSPFIIINVPWSLLIRYSPFALLYYTTIITIIIIIIVVFIVIIIAASKRHSSFKTINTTRLFFTALYYNNNKVDVDF